MGNCCPKTGSEQQEQQVLTGRGKVFQGEVSGNSYQASIHMISEPTESLYRAIDWEPLMKQEERDCHLIIKTTKIPNPHHL